MKKVLIKIMILLCVILSSCSSNNKKQIVNHSGSVMLYSSLEKKYLNIIKDAFETEYPGVTMDYYYNDDVSKISNKLEKEYLYDQINADVLMVGNQLTAENFKDKNYLEKYVSDEGKKINKKFIDSEGYYYPSSIQSSGFICLKHEENKDYPRSFDDLTKEKYKGKFAFTNPDLANNFKFFVACMMQNKKYGKRFFELLKGNEAKLVKSPDDSINNLTNNVVETSILYDRNCINYLNDEENAFHFEYPKSDVVVLISPISLVKNAINSDNGKLLIDFILSKKCQDILINAGLFSARKDIKNPINTKRLANICYNIDLKDLKENFDEYINNYKEIFNN